MGSPKAARAALTRRDPRDRFVVAGEPRREGHEATKQKTQAVTAALAGLDANALSAALTAEISKVDRIHGDDAFEHDRLAVCVHAASHAAAGHHEHVAFNKIEIYRVPQPAVSATFEDLPGFTP